MIGAYEVSQGEWEAVMGTRPWDGQENIISDPNRPASAISWTLADDFCSRLSELEGRRCRLPTEAEWEYTLRAGTKTQYFFGPTDELAGEYGWFGAAGKGVTAGSDPAPRERGLKRPNPWNVYDMTGNTWEWCSDWYSDDYYRESPAVDPKGPATGKERVIRGGSIWNSSSEFRSAGRAATAPEYRNFGMGLRVVVEVD